MCHEALVEGCVGRPLAPLEEFNVLLRAQTIEYLYFPAWAHTLWYYRQRSTVNHGFGYISDFGWVLSKICSNNLSEANIDLPSLKSCIFRPNGHSRLKIKPGFWLYFWIGSNDFSETTSLSICFSIKHVTVD